MELVTPGAGPVLAQCGGLPGSGDLLSPQPLVLHILITANTGIAGIVGYVYDIKSLVNHLSECIFGLMLMMT